jgi:hypothetical protein
MKYVDLLLKIAPFSAFLYMGIYSILEVLFVRLRDADFDRCKTFHWWTRVTGTLIRKWFAKQKGVLWEDAVA